jgi:malate/lactate dehydrogenase
MQGIWQESTETVVLGEAHGSSLIADESRSNLNALITANILNHTYPRANMVLVNHVCDGGNALLAALRRTFL